MANEAKLVATKRIPGEPKEIRDSGHIPCVVYGPGVEEESILISIEYQAFRRVFREAGESTLIDLEYDGRTIPVLVHILDLHPVSEEFEHIDFFAVRMGQELNTNIPLVFVGLAPVVKEKNAVLVRSKEELSVKCLPRNLVHDITVDISSLENYHEHISVKDITPPEGITFLDDPDDVIISATPPKKERTEDEETLEGEEGEEGGEEGEEKKEGEGEKGEEKKED